MLGKSNNVLRIDQEIICNLKLNLQEVLSGFYQININPREVEMDELPK